MKGSESSGFSQIPSGKLEDNNTDLNVLGLFLASMQKEMPKGSDINSTARSNTLGSAAGIDRTTGDPGAFLVSLKEELLDSHPFLEDTNTSLHTPRLCCSEVRSWFLVSIIT